MKRFLFAAGIIGFHFLTMQSVAGHPQREVGIPKSFHSTLRQKPFPGVVPDKATAIAIAVAVLKPMYSEYAVNEERPFIASLKGSVWTVVGTFHDHGEAVSGGVTTVRLSKRTGEILHVSASM